MPATKKAKTAIVKHFRIPSWRYETEYQCPGCHTIFKAGEPGKNVLRFVCKCGQVIIAKHEDIGWG